MADDLLRLEDWLSPLIARLQPAERRQLAREVAISVRKANQQSMAAQQSPDGQAWEPRKNRSRDAKGRLRQGPMFRRMRMARHLRTKAFTDSAVVQFIGRAERIARVHHFGLRDRVAPGGAEYSYPERPLLGISQDQLEQLRDIILDRLAGS
ncbi:phage virion morphogenesis protein [Comamonas sp. CMM03]|uniref:phage virion morphogenesis protein n=1 Tax=Comamonas TaxID=283 RepID=UPI001C45C15B|nr:MULTISPECIES: phage virion morphogenesis protein [Comamonas]MBV7417965.1 phage virion morphogenesis protein [Comamonas sp. CMM03]